MPTANWPSGSFGGVPMRPSSSLNGGVAATWTSAATILPSLTLPLYLPIAICRGISCRKSCSREKTIFTGVPRSWFAISASALTFSNSRRCPKLPPDPLVVEGHLFGLHADRFRRNVLHRLRRLVADPDFHPVVGHDADAVERFQRLVADIRRPILRLQQRPLLDRHRYRRRCATAWRGIPA